MTADSITGILRAILAAAGGILIGLGWFDAATWSWLSGAIITIAATGWSIWSNRPANIAATAQSLKGVSVTTSAAASPEVKKAVASAKTGS